MHFKQEIGRSKDGLAIEIHAVVDGLVDTIRIHLTEGHVHDITPANGLSAGLYADQTIADKAYDAEKFLSLALDQGSEIIVPPRSNRTKQR